MSDLDLKERLRDVEWSGKRGGAPCERDTTCWHRNPDGPEAADRIAALEDALRRIEAEDSEEVPVKHGWCFYSDEPYTTPAHTKHGPFAQIARAVLKGDA